MHEYSVVAALIELCEEQARAHHAQSIKRVVVALGERSGVEEQLFCSAFDVFKLDSLCASSELEIIKKPVKMRCDSCGYEASLKDIAQGECPKCKEQRLSMIEGKEMYLQSLEFEVSDEG
ncbi:MAG: hydrogenase/urease nickel incorporation protein HypA [Wolinella sp.]